MWSPVARGWCSRCVQEVEGPVILSEDVQKPSILKHRIVTPRRRFTLAWESRERTQQLLSFTNIILYGFGKKSYCMQFSFHALTLSRFTRTSSRLRQKSKSAATGSASSRPARAVAYGLASAMSDAGAARHATQRRK